MRASEEQFRVFAQTIPNQLWAADNKGDLDWFNHQVIEYSGRLEENLAGSGWGTLVHPDDLGRAGAAWAQSVGSGAIYEVEFRIRRHDGEYRWFLARAEPTRDADGRVTGWVGTNTEIEEQRRQALELEALAQSLESQVEARTAELMSAEEALRQSQKMEAVGQLTGGLAHDFNNLLTGISGGLEMIALKISQGRLDDIERYSAAAQSAAKRAAALTHRLLAFSRRQTLDPRPTDVNRLVAGMEELVRRTVGPDIDARVVEPATALWPIKVDQNQLENALLNLAINARDAMPDGGRLTIEIANSTTSAARGRRPGGRSPGQYVSLCVTDTGTGMTPEVIAQGLRSVLHHQAARRGHGARPVDDLRLRRASRAARCASTPSPARARSVCLYLPRGRRRGPEPRTDAPTPSRCRRASEGETVLVVDDEAGDPDAGRPTSSANSAIKRWRPTTAPTGSRSCSPTCASTC